ncbi:hypothetical protein CapIbe_007113 [Capra ibex]
MCSTCRLGRLIDHEVIKHPSASDQCGLFVHLGRGCEPRRLPGMYFSLSWALYYHNKRLSYNKAIYKNFEAFCSNYEKTATNGKPCPKIHKPVCGTDGQTYHNLCEFCKVAKERNWKLNFKHEGKC